MKKILSILFAIMMLFSIFSCLSVGAVNSATADEVTASTSSTPESNSVSDIIFSDEYELGAVIVSVRYGSPSVEMLLADFEIVESSVIMSLPDQSTCYYIRFAEKTDKVVWEAISVLSESPYVKYAEPNYRAYIDLPVESPETEFELGAVLVVLKKDAPSVDELLPDFEIVEIKSIENFSEQTTCYYVKFAEETEEIVWKAIAVLSQSPYVKYAEPNYFLYVEPPVEESTTEAPTQPTSVAQPTTEIIATTSENQKSSTSDTPETKTSATSDTAKTVNSNGAVQTGQNNSVMILALLLIISAAATAVFIKFRYRD